MDLGLVQDSVQGVFDWWYTVDESDVWQNRIFYSLAGAYGVIALIALIQLVRIELRVPEYGWTTQKVFHLLNFIVNGVRAVVFIFRHGVQALAPVIWHSVLLDLPGLLFFTTYTLLVLFWAEIYHQWIYLTKYVLGTAINMSAQSVLARSLPTDNLRPAFLIINIGIYIIQACIWVYLWWTPSTVLVTVSKLFFAGKSIFLKTSIPYVICGAIMAVLAVSLVAAIGFLLYGGRLFLMLRRFPIESKGRRKKLREVGCVTAICFTCFTIRSIIMSFSVFDKEANLDVLDHPLLNLIYYTLTEIIPSALVLYILRKLPPKKMASGQYHPIR